MNWPKAALWIVVAICATVGFNKLAEGVGPAVNQQYGMGTIIHPSVADGGGTANGTQLFNYMAKRVGCPKGPKAISVTPPTGSTVKCACSGPDVGTIRDPTTCGSGCDQTQFNATISEAYCVCDLDGGPRNDAGWPGGQECKVNCGI